MPRAYLLSTVPVVLAAAVAAWGIQESQEADPALMGKLIRVVDYDTGRAIDRARLDAATGIAVGGVLSRTLVKRAIQGLYDTGRFADMSVLALPEADGVRLRFELQPAYYFNRFTVAGELELGGKALWELVDLPVGERFSEGALARVRESLLRYLRERGYFLAEVSAQPSRNETNLQVDTVLAVRRGDRATLRGLKVIGVSGAELETVRSRLGLRPGKPYEPFTAGRRIDRLRNHLAGRGFLAVTAGKKETFHAAENSVDVEVEISNLGRVRVAIEGFKLPRDRLRRLLPVFSGEGADPGVFEEGSRNIMDYLEGLGYPEAEVSVADETDRRGDRVITYRIEAGPKVTVAWVRFKGNSLFTERQLLDSIQIQPARFLQKQAYSIARLDADVETLMALYQARGYLDAKVIPVLDPLGRAEKLGISFEIEEGPVTRVRSVSISGNAHLSGEVLQRRMQLRAGAPYSPHLAEKDRQAILAAYNDAGFLRARVVWQPGERDGAGTVAIGFEVGEEARSFVDDVVVLGNERTRPSVIGNRLRLAAGEPLSLGRMLQTQQSLYGLGIFDLVRVSPQNPDSASPFQSVVVRVEESKKTTVRYGLGYQERERLRGTVEFSRLNILGTGQRADLRLRGSRIEQGAVLSFQPSQVRFLPVNSYFSLSARQKKEVSFDARRINLSYQLSRAAGSHAWTLVRYNARNVKLSNLQLSPSEIERADRPRNLSTLSAIYVNDTRDNYLDPEKGFFTSTDLSITTKLPGFAGSVNSPPGQPDQPVETSNYLSMFSQNSYFRRLSDSVVGAASLRFGLSWPFGGTTIPVSERFFAGGGSTLRGFDTDRAGPLDPVTGGPTGGLGLVIANFEVRTPLVRSLHLAGFYDTGNVFRRVGDISLGRFSHSVGVGLRFKTPFGPLRADYGFNLNLSSDFPSRGDKRGHLYLTIGPPF